MSGEVRRSAFLGMRDMAPILVPVIPAGILLGVAIAESDIPAFVGWLSSSFIFGAAAQLTAVTLIAEGAGPVAAALAALTVNARHVMYSAAIVPRFRHQPTWFRRLGPYLMVDQAFALGITHEARPAHWRAYFLGAGGTAWVLWQILTGLGILFGPLLPEDLDAGFALPALFLGLLIPILTRRPAVLAAVTGAVVTGVLWQIPNRGGMLIGGLAGAAAGYLAERRE